MAGEKSSCLNTDAADVLTSQEPEREAESAAVSALISGSVETLWFGRSGTSEEPQERRPGSYVDTLADLLGHYCPGKADLVSVKPSHVMLSCPSERSCPTGNDNLRSSVRTSLYEPMLALASPASPALCLSHVTPSHRDSLIYERCLQCRRGQNGCLLPKATPSEIRDLSIQPEPPEASIRDRETAEEGKRPASQEPQASNQTGRLST